MQDFLEKIDLGVDFTNLSGYNRQHKGGVNPVVRSLNFSDDLYERMKKLAEEKEITISSLVKMACKEYVIKEEAKMKQQDT